MLTKKEQKELLKIARATIVSYVTDSQIPSVETASRGLNLESGCFVTIKQHGQLRGCIGNFISDQPLYRLVQEMAPGDAGIVRARKPRARSRQRNHPRRANRFEDSPSICPKCGSVFHKCRRTTG